jgi:ABC-type multidrug transport system ATPase subunit
MYGCVVFVADPPPVALKLYKRAQIKRSIQKLEKWGCDTVITVDNLEEYLESFDNISLLRYGRRVTRQTKQSKQPTLSQSQSGDATGIDSAAPQQGTCLFFKWQTRLMY